MNTHKRIPLLAGEVPYMSYMSTSNVPSQRHAPHHHSRASFTVPECYHAYLRFVDSLLPQHRNLLKSCDQCGDSGQVNGRLCGCMGQNLMLAHYVRAWYAQKLLTCGASHAAPHLTNGIVSPPSAPPPPPLSATEAVDTSGSGSNGTANNTVGGNNDGASVNAGCNSAVGEQKNADASSGPFVSRERNQNLGLSQSAGDSAGSHVTPPKGVRWQLRRLRTQMDMTDSHTAATSPHVTPTTTGKPFNISSATAFALLFLIGTVAASFIFGHRYKDAQPNGERTDLGDNVSSGIFVGALLGAGALINAVPWNGIGVLSFMSFSTLCLCGAFVSGVTGYWDDWVPATATAWLVILSKRLGESDAYKTLSPADELELDWITPGGAYWRHVQPSSSLPVADFDLDSDSEDEGTDNQDITVNFNDDAKHHNLWGSTDILHDLHVSGLQSDDELSTISDYQRGDNALSLARQVSAPVHPWLPSDSSGVQKVHPEHDKHHALPFPSHWALWYCHLIVTVGARLMLVMEIYWMKRDDEWTKPLFWLALSTFVVPVELFVASLQFDLFIDPSEPYGLLKFFIAASPLYLTLLPLWHCLSRWFGVCRPFFDRDRFGLVTVRSALHDNVEVRILWDHRVASLPDNELRERNSPNTMAVPACTLLAAKVLRWDSWQFSPEYEQAVSGYVKERCDDKRWMVGCHRLKRSFMTEARLTADHLYIQAMRHSDSNVDLLHLDFLVPAYASLLLSVSREDQDSRRVPNDGETDPGDLFVALMLSDFMQSSFLLPQWSPQSHYCAVLGLFASLAAASGSNGGSDGGSGGGNDGAVSDEVRPTALGLLHMLTSQSHQSHQSHHRALAEAVAVAYLLPFVMPQRHLLYQGLDCVTTLPVLRCELVQQLARDGEFTALHRLCSLVFDAVAMNHETVKVSLRHPSLHAESSFVGHYCATALDPTHLSRSSKVRNRERVRYTSVFNWLQLRDGDKQWTSKGDEASLAAADRLLKDLSAQTLGTASEQPFHTLRSSFWFTHHSALNAFVYPETQRGWAVHLVTVSFVTGFFACAAPMLCWSLAYTFG